MKCEPDNNEAEEKTLYQLLLKYYLNPKKEIDNLAVSEVAGEIAKSSVDNQPFHDVNERNKIR
jgi:hypothetical protein